MLLTKISALGDAPKNTPFLEPTSQYLKELKCSSQWEAFTLMRNTTRTLRYRYRIYYNHQFMHSWHFFWRPRPFKWNPHLFIYYFSVNVFFSFQTFDPDRFSVERKSELVSGTFMPFGAGPRICLGLRVSRLEIKVKTQLGPAMVNNHCFEWVPTDC